MPVAAWVTCHPSARRVSNPASIASNSSVMLFHTSMTVSGGRTAGFSRLRGAAGGRIKRSREISVRLTGALAAVIGGGGAVRPFTSALAEEVPLCAPPDCALGLVSGEDRMGTGGEEEGTGSGQEGTRRVYPICWNVSAHKTGRRLGEPPVPVTAWSIRRSKCACRLGRSGIEWAAIYLRDPWQHCSH